MPIGLKYFTQDQNNFVPKLNQMNPYPITDLTGFDHNVK